MILRREPGVGAGAESGGENDTEPLAEGFGRGLLAQPARRPGSASPTDGSALLLPVGHRARRDQLEYAERHRQKTTPWPSSNEDYRLLSALELVNSPGPDTAELVAVNP